MDELKRLVLHDGPPTEGEKAFDDALESLNQGVRRANIPPDVPGVVEYCRCPCHHNRGMIHFTACCRGRCKGCGFHIIRGKEAHEPECIRAHPPAEAP